MKINNTLGPNLKGLEDTKGNKGLENLGKKSKSEAAGSKDLQGSAKVNISQRSQMMNKAKEIATNTEDVNEAKVARLQKMIDEGKYNINASAIADKLVDEHMMLPSE